MSEKIHDSTDDLSGPGQKGIIPKEIEEIIKNLPKEQQEKIIKSTFLQSSLFRGPLPPPSILEDYNKVIVNGAERIMKMAENQTNHRIELENLAVKEELRQSALGQKYGFTLAILGILSALIMALMGHDTVAGVFGTTTIIGLVTVFVIGKKKQNTD